MGGVVIPLQGPTMWGLTKTPCRHSPFRLNAASNESAVCINAAFSIEDKQEEARMAVPKSKISNSRRGMRRSHDRLTAVNYVEDKDSGELRRQHHIDLKTGMYKGRQVLDPKD